VVLMASVSTILMSTADVGQFTTLRQYRAEDDVRFDYIEDSVKAIFTQKAVEQSLILPSNTSLTIGDCTVSVDASVGTGAKSRMILLDTTISGKKKSRSRQLVIGRRKPVSPFWFGLGSIGTLELSNTITCSSDVMLNGDLSGSFGLTSSAQVYTPRSSFTTNPDAANGIKYQTATVSPSLDSTAYSAAADNIIASPILPITFVGMGGYQSLYYRNGDAMLNTSYTGRGTVFINGNLTIRNLTRLAADDEIVLIVNGNVVIESNRIPAFLFCSGNVSYAGGGNLTIDGALFCNKLEMGGKKLTVNFDPFFWDAPRWDQRMRVPGMW
jgi:hypothetical protein